MEKFTMEQVNEILNVITKLVKLGFTRDDTTTDFNGYHYANGSICNYVKVTLGEVRSYTNCLGEQVLGMYVSYEAEREGSDDFNDYHTTEKRVVALDSLIEYLAQKGIRKHERRGRA